MKAISQKSIQIGNAIPPLLADAVAGRLLVSDRNAPRRYAPGLVKYSVTKSKAMGPKLYQLRSPGAVTVANFALLRAGNFKLETTEVSRPQYSAILFPVHIFVNH